MIMFQPVKRFQSTSPVRGTTHYFFAIINITKISIHVPREGDDEELENE